MIRLGYGRKGMQVFAWKEREGREEREEWEEREEFEEREESEEREDFVF